MIEPRGSDEKGLAFPDHPLVSRYDRRCRVGREGTLVPLTVVPDLPADDSQPATGLTSSSLIDEIVQESDRTMHAAAPQAEVDAYIAAFADERDEQGRRLVARNGCHAPRVILIVVEREELAA